MQKRKIKRYGWRHSPPDPRDHIFSATHTTITTLPASISLMDQMPPIRNQGELGCCVAEAIATAFEVELGKQGLTDMQPSVLFIYWNARSIEGSQMMDGGCCPRDALTAMSQVGVASETSWGFDPGKVMTQPAEDAFAEAKNHMLIRYQRVALAPMQVKAALAEGYPVVFGMSVFESMETDDVARTGIVPLPRMNEQMVATHAVVLVGIDDATSMATVRNSWGDSWGQKGYFQLPYAYLFDTTLCADLWTIRLISG